MLFALNMLTQEKYSLLISNHTGFYDIIINMYVNACGFMAKDETQKYPFVGELLEFCSFCD